MKKEELSLKLKAVRNKIKELKAIEAPVYATQNKFIPSIGYIFDIETLRDCAKALSIVKKYFSSEVEEASELGISEKDLAADSNYLGHKLSVWQKDIQNRVTEIKNDDMLEKLEVAEKTLMKHRTGDDIFNEDMENIGDVLDLV